MGIKDMSKIRHIYKVLIYGTNNHLYDFMVLILKSSICPTVLSYFGLCTAVWESQLNLQSTSYYSHFNWSCCCFFGILRYINSNQKHSGKVIKLRSFYQHSVAETEPPPHWISSEPLLNWTPLQLNQVPKNVASSDDFLRCPKETIFKMSTFQSKTWTAVVVVA